MAFTAALDTLLSAGGMVQRELIVECRSGYQAYASEDFVEVPVVKGDPKIDRGGSLIAAKATFTVVRKYAGDPPRLEYWDDYDPDNPVQTGAEVRIKARFKTAVGWEEEYVFRGYIDEVEPSNETLKVVAYDKLWRALRSACKIGDTGTDAEDREGYMECGISHTFNGQVALSQVGATNQLEVDRIAHPQAYYDDGVIVWRRGWKNSGVRLYKNGAEVPTREYEIYYATGIIELANAPGGAAYTLEQNGDFTLKVYDYPGAPLENPLTVGRVLTAGLTFDRILAADPVPVGPAFAAGELDLSPGGTLSYLEWDICNGTFQDLLNKILSKKFSLTYKLYYDPVHDKIIGLDEADFATKRENVEDDPPVYDIPPVGAKTSAIYWEKTVSWPRSVTDVSCAVIARGRHPTPSALIQNAGQIDDKLEDGVNWIKLDLVPFTKFDQLGQLIDGKINDDGHSDPGAGYGIRKDVNPGTRQNWLEVDLTGAAENTQVSKIVLSMCQLDGEAALPIRVELKPNGGTYQVVSDEANEYVMRAEEVKEFRCNLITRARYLRISAVPSDLFGAGRDDGVLVLGELQAYGAETFCEPVMIQKDDAGETRTYHPDLLKKYYALGLPTDLDTYELVRTADDIQDRGKTLVYAGLRKPRAMRFISNQPDPRELLYKTTVFDDDWNKGDQVPVLIIGTKLTPDGVEIEAVDIYSDPPVGEWP